MKRGGRDEKTDTKKVKNGGPEGGACTTRARYDAASGRHAPAKKWRVRARGGCFDGGVFVVGLGISRRLRWYILSFDTLTGSIKNDTNSLMCIDREKVSREKLPRKRIERKKLQLRR
jgi:hypothetical protein